MKKSFAISIILALSVNAVLSQAPSGFNAHPCHVVGNVIDSSGEVIDQLTADFQYKSDGTLQYFDSPLYNYHSQYRFSNQLPISIYATYSFDEYGGKPLDYPVTINTRESFHLEWRSISLVKWVRLPIWSSSSLALSNCRNSR